jgi:hypothetical protein
VPDADPPPRKFTFKERTFESVNPPAGSPPTADSIDLASLIRAANTPGKAASGATPPTPLPPPGNEVQALLRTNEAYETAARLPGPPRPPKAASRRKRDYFVTLIAGNLLLAAAVVISGNNVVVLAYGASGMIVLTLGLTWIMWFVMDDY